MSNSKVIALLEELLKEVKAGGCDCATAAPELSGNRTRAVTNYDGNDNIQNLMDVARRAVRYAREGKRLSKKERKLAREVMRDVKEEYGDILNTNGHDIWTIHGL